MGRAEYIKFVVRKYKLYVQVDRYICIPSTNPSTRTASPEAVWPVSAVSFATALFDVGVILPHSAPAYLQPLYRWGWWSWGGGAAVRFPGLRPVSASLDKEILLLMYNYLSK